MAAAAPANNYSPGLEGVIAGITKICTVGKEGSFDWFSFGVDADNFSSPSALGHLVLLS